MPKVFCVFDSGTELIKLECGRRAFTLFDRSKIAIDKIAKKVASWDLSVKDPIHKQLLKEEPRTLVTRLDGHVNTVMGNRPTEA